MEDFNLIVQNLEAENYNIDSAILAMLQMNQGKRNSKSIELKATNKQKREQQRLEKKKRQEERHRQKALESKNSHRDNNRSETDVNTQVTLVKTFAALNI
ncbi:PREDICTED: OTU domain-containing protein 3-like [Elephantulus edwardii]|uniref:OTU domain-containing protein 3-like n=1 Tax=Elephantulus edwardii TaxID=28737 RepID=UPI0003F0BF3C|nr:PREDICTED: OTU domain-containing protein 3-like [Elephantulus edwardii]